MPKLPDIEYAVVTQGPPNVAQAFGSLANAADAFTRVQNEALMSFAEEQAKTQTATAAAVFSSGLSQREAYLKTQPHLSPREVQDMLGGEVSPQVREVLDRAGSDLDSKSIPTWEVGAAIHAATAKQLAAEVAPGIYAPKVRAQFERQAMAETVARNSHLEMAMAEQGAKYMKAQTLVNLDLSSDAANTPEAWAGVYRTLAQSNSFLPFEKEEIKAKLDAKRVGQPIYDAIRSNDPEQIKVALASVDDDGAMVGVNPQHRAAYKKMLSGALEGIEREQDKAAAREEKARADAATNRVLALRQRSLGGQPVTPAQYYAALPPVGSVPPTTLEHLQGMVADAMKPKEAQTKTDLGAWALVQNSRVTYPEEWAQGIVVLPDGKKTSIIGLHKMGGLSLGDAKTLLDNQADAAAKPDAVRVDVLQKTDTDEINRLLEDQYKFNLNKKAGDYVDSNAGKTAGWMYKVVESELAAASHRKGGAKLDVDERSAIIRKVLAREVKTVSTWGGLGSKQTVENVGIVPPDFETAFHNLPSMPGRNASHQDIAKAYSTFVEKYQGGTDETWRAATGGRPLRAQDAAYITVLLETNKAAIDEELKRAGKFNLQSDAANDPMRAALATMRYLKSGQWRRR